MNIETVLLTDQQDQEATVLSDQEPEEIVPAQQQDVMSKKNQQKEEERMALLDEQGGGEGGIRLKKKKFVCVPRKRFNCIILLVVVLSVVIVSCLIATAVSVPLYLADKSANTMPPNDKLSLEDTLNSSFRVKSYSGQWTSDGEILHFSNSDGVQLFSPNDNMTQTIISQSILMNYNVSSVKLSPNRNYALFVSNYEKVYRHSFLADYFIIHIADTSSVWPLPLPEGEVATSSSKMQYAVWSPNDRHNRVAYVYNNNVYIYDLLTNESIRHTDNGKENELYNGIPDWVYEEEVLSSNHALWWSPNGEHVAFLTFNDSGVKSFQYPIYGSVKNPYTEIESIAYPKAGTANPIVQASLLSINGTIQELRPPPDNNYYVMYVVWGNDSTPMISWMNRNQSSMTYCLYQPPLYSSCDDVHIQQSEAWIELVQPPLFVNGGQAMILIAPVLLDDQTDSYLHIVQIDIPSSEMTPLTKGSWEVTSIIGVSDDEILYTSTQTHSWQRHIYRVNGDCLTCDQEQWIDNAGSLQSNECHYWSGTCSNNLSHCILYCSGPTLPFTVLVEYKDGIFHPVTYFETNYQLRNIIGNLDLPTVEELEIPADGSSPSLYARVMLPPGANLKKCSRKYPMLFYVYGGPYSQMIGQYSVVSRLFPLYLSSSLDMIVVSVDGRGTGFRGDKFKHSVYRQLGILETQDQIRAAKYFQEQCYPEKRNIAIYGSSYGGYMAGMVGAASGSKVFSTAISQSPVTEWRYYDTIYTERYMGLPTQEDNLEGYESSSLLARAVNLSAVDYLLIHGTGDDNVHFQNTAQLVRTLTIDDITFKLQFYTDQAHSLSGTPKHLYLLIENFLKESFAVS